MSNIMDKNDEEILKHIHISPLTLSFEDTQIQQLYDSIQRSKWPVYTECIVSVSLLILVLIYIHFLDISQKTSYLNLIAQIVFTLINISFIFKFIHSYQVKRQFIYLQILHFFLYFIFDIIPMINEDVPSPRAQGPSSFVYPIICTNTGISLIIVMMLIQSYIFTWYEKAIIQWIISLCDQSKSGIFSIPQFYTQMLILLIIYTIIIYLTEKNRRQKFFINYWQNNLLSEWKDIWKNTIPTPIIILGIPKQINDQQTINQNAQEYERHYKQGDMINNKLDHMQASRENPKEKENLTQPFPQMQDENQYNLIQASIQNNQQPSNRQKNITTHGQLLEMNDIKLINVTQNQIEETPQVNHNKTSSRENIQLHMQNNQINQLQIEPEEKQKQKLSEECKKADMVSGKENSQLITDRNKIQANSNSVFAMPTKDEENIIQKEEKVNIEIDQLNKENDQFKFNPYFQNHFTNENGMQIDHSSFFQFKDANKQFYNTFNITQNPPQFYQNELQTLMEEIKDNQNISLYKNLVDLINSLASEFERKSHNFFKNQVLKTYNQLSYKEKYFEAKIIECEWDDQDKSFMIILNDITEKVVNEQNKQQYQYKDQILAIATHDLKTPLNNIICSVESMKLRQDNTNISEQLELVSVSVKQMMNIIKDILDYSALNKGSLRLNIEIFRLSDLIKQIFQLFKLHAQSRNIELKYTIDPFLQELDIVSDPSRLVQIFNNLIANSLKFTVKGSIHIKFKSNPNDRNVIHISITDTGVGIPQQYVDQIFKPFQTFNHTEGLKTQGVGLGLIICKTLVRQLGPSQQRIGLKTQQNIGSKICFDFYRNINDKPQPCPKRKNTTLSENEMKNTILFNMRDKKMTIYSSPQKQSCEALLIEHNTERSQKCPMINWKNDSPKISKATVFKVANKEEDPVGLDLDYKKPQKEVNTPHKRINQIKINDKQDSSCVIKDYQEQEPVVQLVKTKQPISSTNLFTQLSLPSQGDFGINNHSEAHIHSSGKQSNSLKQEQIENQTLLNIDNNNHTNGNNKLAPRISNFNFLHVTNNNHDCLSTQVNSSQNTGLISTNNPSQNHIPSIQIITNNIQGEQNQQDNLLNHESSHKNQDTVYAIQTLQSSDNNGYDAQFQKLQNNNIEIIHKKPTFENKARQKIMRQQSYQAEQNYSPKSSNNQINEKHNQYNNSPTNSEFYNNNSPSNNNFTNINSYSAFTPLNHLSKFYTSQTPINSKKNFINSNQNTQITPQRSNIKSATLNLSNTNRNNQIQNFSNAINQNNFNIQNSQQKLNNIITQQFSQSIIKSTQQYQNYIVPVLGEVSEEFNDSIYQSQKISLQNQQSNTTNALIIDDEYVHFVIFSQLLKNISQNYHFQFDYATNGQEALDLIEKKPESYYKIVFVDGSMPVMSGYDFIQRIRQYEQNKQYLQKHHIIGVTGGGERDKNQFLSAGADYYIQKPVQTSILIEYLNQLMSKDNNQ
ncbi:ATPase, histidine kinase-, DNA gyrase B (macronuclear) [Tetrahymena thermophila SB210]|uniref:histidine kinase n=1 Tax=Tetrahymena thermophila (strain SB210) TaxID=312017 RepID=Q237N5_TETTS|nr:ATPase, histidine kinase-, DNA gyrase B [Tetrahymena thermophila SB210]EAR92706.2 ATPase, histidine kinase-, DNA gyrase B [Tetrahymena thermophila SB210]|eukprot:XP_001012951.2 ATPase, histidine kinase-, DNA gyrase B [Tetrahymena thermophila SB210]